MPAASRKSLCRGRTRGQAGRPDHRYRFIWRGWPRACLAAWRDLNPGISIVFLQISHTLRSGRITRNEFIEARFGKQYPRAVCILRAIFNIVGAVMFALLFWQSYPLLTKALRRGEYFGNEFVFTFPTWPTKVLILVGCGALVIQFLRMAVNEIRTAAKNEFPGDEVDSQGKL